MLHSRRDSYNDINEPDFDDPFFRHEPSSPDDEEIYQETLLEEVKQLQDMYNVAQQEKQSEEAQRIKLNQLKNKLEHQVQQLNEVYISVFCNNFVSHNSVSLAIHLQSLFNALV